jgi:hypothetical protein
VDDAAATAVTAEVGRRRIGMWVTLALVLLAGGAFHAREYWVRQTRAESVRLTGVPAGFVGAPAAPGRPQVLLRAGPAPDPAEVDRFRKEQAARGYKVVELPSGGLMLVPPQANERPAAQKEAP